MMSRPPPLSSGGGASRGHSIRTGAYEDASQHMPGSYAAVPPVPTGKTRRPVNASGGAAAASSAAAVSGGNGSVRCASSPPLKPLASVKLRRGTNEDESQLMPDLPPFEASRNSQLVPDLSACYRSAEDGREAPAKTERNLGALSMFDSACPTPSRDGLSPPVNSADRALARHSSAGHSPSGSTASAAAAAAAAVAAAGAGVGASRHSISVTAAVALHHPFPADFPQHSLRNTEYRSVLPPSHGAWQRAEPPPLLDSTAPRSPPTGAAFKAPPPPPGVVGVRTSPRSARVASAGTASEIASELDSISNAFSFATLTSDADDSARNAPWMSPLGNFGGGPGGEILRGECADMGGEAERGSGGSWETVRSNRQKGADATWEWVKGTGEGPRNVGKAERGQGAERGEREEGEWAEEKRGKKEGGSRCRKFSLEQVEGATDGFSEANLLGKGAFGQVYKGYLLGCSVAVKRLEGGGWQGPKEYSTEVEVLNRMRHPHLLLLIGHCPDPKGMCILYEYLPGGSLQEYLNASGGGGSGGGGSGSGGGSGERVANSGLADSGSGVAGPAAGLAQRSRRQPLPWYDRVRILSEVSGALLYLHQHSPPIAHRDLKPANVLLDGNRRSKLGDVGLARLVAEDGYDVTANVRGTAGYIDPVEVETCEVSVLSDVYAFGLIVLQLLMGEGQVRGVHRLLADAAGKAGRGESGEGREGPAGGGGGGGGKAGVVGGGMNGGVRSGGVGEGLFCPESCAAAVDAVLARLDRSAGAWHADVARQLAVIGVRCADRARARRPDLGGEVQPLLMRLAEGVREEEGRGRTDMDSQLLCPLLKKRMTDPVIAADGFTYERDAIEDWLQHNDASPTTGVCLPHKFLTPNNTLRMLLGSP